MTSQPPPSSSTLGPESLTRQCLQVLTNEFCQGPSPPATAAEMGSGSSYGLPRGLPRAMIPAITARLPTSLSVLITAPSIEDENYWKKCCLATAEDTTLEHLAAHGLTWKQLYLERTIATILETFDPATSDLERDVLALVSASAPYIFNLRLTQLLSHVDLALVASRLPNLARLDLSYGVSHIGMKYERMLFGMKISDASALSRLVSSSSTLTSLLLPSNLLDDDLLRVLVEGLAASDTVTCLDLSHNKLTNHGARLVAKLLHPTSVLSTLDVSDNDIHAEGGRYLSRGLRTNASLTRLNVRLNRLTDEGGRMILDGLRDNPKSQLRELNLSANALGVQTAASLARVLALPSCALVSLDLTSNQFAKGDAELLERGLETNEMVTGLDLRQNPDLPADSPCLVNMSKILRRNELAWRNQSL